VPLFFQDCLSKLPYRSTLLSCPHDDCNSLVFDGTAIGPDARQFKAKDYYDPKLMPRNELTKIVGGRTERRLINEVDARKMLIKLSHLKRAHGKDIFTEAELTVADYQKELNTLTSSAHPLSKAVATFLSGITYEENGIIDAPRFLLPFINELGFDYSSSFGFLMLPSSRCRNIFLTVATMSNSILRNESILNELRQCCPLVYDVFVNLHLINEKPFKDVLLEIFKSYYKTFEQTNWFDTNVDVEACSQDRYVITGRDLVRRPRNYLQSESAGTQELIGLGDCKKIPTSSLHHSQLFTAICEHKFIQIATPMLQAESPRFLFYLLLCYWKKPPKYIIYDNACHAHEYCINREPDFFKDSIFCIDKFHYRNHTACTRSFDSRRYPETSIMNSQVCEQFNRDLNRVSNSIHYSGIESYKVLITTFMLVKNFRRRNNLPT
jgi:hypothetical protein